MKKKRERNETLRATDEQQVVKKSSASCKRETRSLHNKKEWKFRAEKDDKTHNKTPSSIVYTFLLSLSLSLSL